MENNGTAVVPCIRTAPRTIRCMYMWYGRTRCLYMSLCTSLSKLSREARFVTIRVIMEWRACEKVCRQCIDGVQTSGPLDLRAFRFRAPHI
jgi:hypothetical protein